MESYIPISYLNDFIFCPRSIYFHNLYSNFADSTFQGSYQVSGKLAHTTIDTHSYSTKKSIVQGLEIYSDRYKLCGKIDIFDTETGELTERKKLIKTIYDGYVFQLYAQYYALQEMEYNVCSLCLYSMQDNKKYPVPLPDNDNNMKLKFEELVENLYSFSLDAAFVANAHKCQRCIYANLCDKGVSYDDDERF